MQKPDGWENWWRHVGGETRDNGEEFEEAIGGTVEELSQGVYFSVESHYNYYIPNNTGENHMVEKLDKKVELELITFAQQGDVKAQERLLNQYERLCHKQARKYAFTAPNHDHEDLVQEGRIGLLQAIKSFDPTIGASFMTWAFYHVRGSIAGCGRIDRKQPKYPFSVEDCPRAYNVEDPSQEPELRDDVPSALIRRILDDCCGGINTKRASIVMDRFGLLGRKELRNCECAEKYGLTKYAVNSHIYQFKRKARDRYPELEGFV